MTVSSFKKYNLIVLNKSDSNQSLELEFNNINQNNLIIDCNQVKLESFLDLFKILFKSQKFFKKSLVILTENISFCNDLNLIPTLQEAIDFIDLEEIERDLDL